MYTLYKFHFLNGISEINQLFDDILIIWPAPVYVSYLNIKGFICRHSTKFKQLCLKNLFKLKYKNDDNNNVQ